MLTSEHRLDTTGLLCPLPILLTAREIARLPVGDTLEVLSDDPGILEDMPAWCQSTGNRLLSMEEEGGVIRCRVERAVGSSPSPQGP